MTDVIYIDNLLGDLNNAYEERDEARRLARRFLQWASGSDVDFFLGEYPWLKERVDGQEEH